MDECCFKLKNTYIHTDDFHDFSGWDKDLKIVRKQDFFLIQKSKLGMDMMLLLGVIMHE